MKKSNYRHPRLFCECRKRPCGCRAAEKRNELASVQLTYFLLPGQSRITEYQTGEDQSVGIQPIESACFATTVASGHATLASKRTLLLNLCRTCTGWIAP